MQIAQLRASPRTSFASQRQIRPARCVRVMSSLKPGDNLPEFELLSDANEQLSSKALTKDNGIVLFSYPRANTSGCTTQACGYRDNYTAFESKGYKIVGISADSPADQAAWKQQYNYQYPLLSDPSKEVLTKLGMLKPDGKINRSHIVVDKGGVVKDVQYGIAAKDSVPEALKVVLQAKSI